MGARIVTVREWILFFGAACMTSSIAALVYHLFSISATARTTHTTLTSIFLSFSTIAIFLLALLRFRAARFFWLQLWVSGAPFFISSIFFLPIKLLFIPLVWLALIGLSLWGYYVRFKIVPDSKLHKARFARTDELADILSRKAHEASLLLGETLLRKFYLVRSTPSRRELGNVLIVAPTRGG